MEEERRVELSNQVGFKVPLRVCWATPDVCRCRAPGLWMQMKEGMRVRRK
jgi:Tfp pilus assembly protein PilZ